MASAWVDRESGCGYKLFDLRKNGSLGTKLQPVINPPYELTIVQTDANVMDTLEKLYALHEAGACPTEIVGLSADGQFLIAKQPRCKSYEDFERDTQLAVREMKAVTPKGTFGMPVRVFWASGKGWFLGDLHKGNIRRLQTGEPTVIDALVCPIPELALKVSPHLLSAVNAARAYSERGIASNDDPFAGINDDDL